MLCWRCKRVEHVHGTLVKHMDKVLRYVRTKQSHTFYRHQLRHLAMRVSASNVSRDVDRLPTTLRVIASSVSEGGTGGNWAPRPYN
jgi:hypothetical protein